MHRFFSLCFICFALNAYAQEKKPQLISGDFRGISIEEFIRQVESKTNYHFYYDPSQFDLLIINAEVKDKTLEEVLTEIFRNSEYNFSIDQQRIFLLEAVLFNQASLWHSPAN